ncbi:hypothetical protein Tco_0774573 [Tanacetum coccineum]|uniref:Uncharacterized protein n=1 Tax=Tanacetum coccineum TaxID=301880 RepID=A0ABQ4ZPV2_9ASTR
MNKPEYPEDLVPAGRIEAPTLYYTILFISSIRPLVLGALEMFALERVQSFAHDITMPRRDRAAVRAEIEGHLEATSSVVELRRVTTSGSVRPADDYGCSAFSCVPSPGAGARVDTIGGHW